VYGDAGLIPDDDDDDDDDPPVRKRARRRTRRGGFGLGRGLRLLAIPILPWVMIITLTPWGQDLYASARDRVSASFGDLFGSTASLTLAPTSGPSTTRVTVIGKGFQPGERVDVFANEKSIDRRNAIADGTVTFVLVPKSKQITTAGPVEITVIGKSANAKATFQLTG
jgi:hypothetical protein